ncbi:hypothetical protein DC969_02515 [Escherichia coli]|nr:hypothetical protein [Escherichia coli]EFO4158978.1 hypothetical protein [Escherichia coli]EGE3001884.1 hypothetical protein [Escherichia coli]
MKAFKLTLSVGFWFAVDTFTSFFTSHINGGCFLALCIKNIRAIVIVGGETAGNVHYLALSDKSFVIICYI